MKTFSDKGSVASRPTFKLAKEKFFKQKGNEKEFGAPGRKTKQNKIWIHRTDSPFPHEFYKLYLMIETKIIKLIPSKDI